MSVEYTQNADGIHNEYYRTNDSWQSPKAIIKDIIGVINMDIKYLVDVCPAKKPTHFIKICKELNIIPIISKHSIQTLSFDKLLALDCITEQIKMDIHDGKVGIYCNPPFKSQSTKLFVDSILLIFNQVKVPVFFVISKKMLGYQSSGFMSLLHRKHKMYQPTIRVYQPTIRYQFFKSDPNNRMYQPNKMASDTVIVTLYSDMKKNDTEYITATKEEIVTDKGKKWLSIYKINSDPMTIRHELSQNPLNEYEMDALLQNNNKK